MEYTEQQKKIYNEVCDKYKHNYLNTTVSQTMAMEMISKALSIHTVMQADPEKVCDDEPKNYNVHHSETEWRDVYFDD